MNKSLYFKICSIAVGSFLIIWSAAFTLFMIKDRNEAKSDIPQHVAENVQKTVQSAKLKHYLAKADGNKVAIYEVYTNGFEKLIGMPDINLSQIPEQDRVSFKQGIILADKSALASLIEDFTS
ncbi:MAG: hypothetical protein IJN62_06035 [Clostridia bacterium]|nr:hypothetical protein [Clostridia bacterium]